MNTISKWRGIGFSAFMCLLVAGCGKGEFRQYEQQAAHCGMDSSEKRADFILQCIGNANPKSDEEPEDWITKCQTMAEETLCPKITMIVTQECVSNFGCYWVERNRQPKSN